MVLSRIHLQKSSLSSGRDDEKDPKNCIKLCADASVRSWVRACDSGTVKGRCPSHCRFLLTRFISQAGKWMQELKKHPSESQDLSICLSVCLSDLSCGGPAPFKAHTRARSPQKIQHFLKIASVSCQISLLNSACCSRPMAYSTLP